MNRFPEIDLARSLAVLMMILFHYAFDLRFFYGWHIDVFSGPWFWLGRLCAILFLLLVGVSFVISWDRTSHRGDPSFWKMYPKFLRRGLFILGCGMLITLVTYFWMETVYIRFGILHLIGTSILLLPFFAKLREWNFLIGILLITSAMMIPSLEPNPSPIVLPLGFHSPSFTSVDYYPLLPWFGVILLGAALGHLFYIRYPGWRTSLSIVHWPLSIPLGWPGRNALLIYMLHQPIILGLLSVMI